MRHFRLGLDFGGVIAGRATSPASPTSRRIDFASVRPVPGAFDSIGALAAALGPRIWIVSKASASTAREARDWLGRHRFFEITGVPPDHLRFCDTDSAKAAVASSLGLTHFVDDTPRVLDLLEGVVARRYLLIGDDAPKDRPSGGPYPTFSDWPKLRDAILRDLAE